MTVTQHAPFEPNGTAGRRAAVTWLAATGAALLLAATAVFTAVHWSALSDREKFAVLVAVTVAALAGGLRIRARVPATGAAVVHLGVLLAPIDVWALGRSAALEWPALLVAIGATGVALATPLSRRLDSVVLAAAGAGFGAVLVAGSGATVGVAAPLLAATVATGLAVARRHRHAVFFALVAGLAPAVDSIVRALQRPPYTGLAVAHRLGLTGVPWLASLATAGLAAAALVLAAHARRDVSLLYLVPVVVAVQVATVVGSGNTPTSVRIVVLPALFVLVELAASFAARDEVLAEPSDAVARFSEGVAVLPTAAVTAALVIARALEAGHRGVASDMVLALTLTAGGWLIAGARRAPSPREWLTGTGVTATQAMLVVSALGASAAAGASPAVLTGALLGVAVVGTIVRHRAGAWLGGLAVVATVLAPTAATGITFGAVATLLGVAALSRRDGAHAWSVDAAGIETLAAWAVTAFELHRTIALSPAVFAFEAGIALLVVARGSFADVVPTWASLAVLAPVELATRHDGWTIAAITVALVVTMLPAVRVVRFLAVVPYVQLLLAVPATLSASWTARSLGVAVFAAIVGGVAARRDRIQRELAAAAAIAGGVATTTAALGAPHDLGAVLIVLGAALAAIAGLRRSTAVTHAGVIVVVAGVLLTLATHDVRTLEWYLTPIAGELLALGVTTRRRRPEIGSWLAYAPGLVVLVGPATYVGMRHDAAPHLLFAGACAIVAVAIGATRRLAAPLLLGTATLVAVSLPTTLGYARGVPAWMWLAIGGAILLSLAVAMERSDQRPGVLGRRVLDVVVRDFA